MVDGGRWWEAIDPVTNASPGSTDELVTVLEQLATIASRWSDLLEEFRDVTHKYGSLSAALSYDLACRRSEQAFIELEIARRNARAGADNDPLN
jgi:hypothetical protein